MAMVQYQFKNMDLQLPMQTVPITTNVVKSKPGQARCTHTTLFDKVCQRLTTCGWFSLGTPFSYTNKTDLHDIIEILLKVALNTITLTLTQIKNKCKTKSED